MQQNTTEDLDLSDFGTQVDDTYHAFRAFNFLIDHLFEYAPGCVSSTIGYGIGQLLRRQVDDLEDINSKVMQLMQHIRTEERRQDRVAAAEDRLREIMRREFGANPDVPQARISEVLAQMTEEATGEIDAPAKAARQKGR